MILRGAEAPFKSEQRKPLFFVRQQSPTAGSARDVLIVRLNKKKDHRELVATSGSTIFNWDDKIPNDRIIPATVNAVADDAFTVIPQGDLVPGEYILTFGTGKDGGFDFQITSGSSKSAAPSGSTPAVSAQRGTAER
jgi:hypothetical protein